MQISQEERTRLLEAEKQIREGLAVFDDLVFRIRMVETDYSFVDELLRSRRRVAGGLMHLFSLPGLSRFK